MSFLYNIPEDLQRPGVKVELIDFLQGLPIRFHYKKYALLEWGEVYKEKIAYEDVLKLGGAF